MTGPRLLDRTPAPRPDDGGGSGVAPAGALPTLLLLGLEHGMTADAAAEQMAALAAVFPGAAGDTAARLALTALALIADGHPDPGGLAGHTLTVCASAGARWSPDRTRPPTRPSG